MIGQLWFVSTDDSPDFSFASIGVRSVRSSINLLNDPVSNINIMDGVGLMSFPLHFVNVTHVSGGGDFTVDTSARMIIFRDPPLSGIADIDIYGVSLSGGNIHSNVKVIFNE